jgi:hypothetical protein
MRVFKQFFLLIVVIYLTFSFGHFFDKYTHEFFGCTFYCDWWLCESYHIITTILLSILVLLILLFLSFRKVFDELGK